MAPVENLPGLPDSALQPRLIDRQGWSTLLAGALLLLISFTTNVGDDYFFPIRKVPAADKVGVGLHLAALAALAGDVQLTTRLRHREQTARRTRIEARYLLAQCRFLLTDTSRNRLQLSEALAVLLEELRRPSAQTSAAHKGLKPRNVFG
jgi:hypothetical protein